MTEFSIIIPLYNKELSIKRTIESVLSQSYPYFELILVNDGSTDGSMEVASGFDDKRIKFVNKVNGGVSSARNVGISEATKEYIAFLDADDLWYENALEEFKYLIQNFADAQVYFTSHTLNIKEIGSYKRRYYIDNYYKQNAISFARNTTALCCTGCVAVHSSCLKSIGGFDEKLTHGEDLDLWKRLSKHFTIAKSDVVTMLYRLEAENRSQETNKIANTIVFFDRTQTIDAYEKLDWGRKYFFYLKQNFTKTSLFKQNMQLIFRYFDLLLQFILLIFRYRLLRNYN